jgi:glycosyltransferase involved in cell wall biosynthesis
MIIKYLKISNVYLFFSWLDNCPNSVIEAIAADLPVICTNQGGTKEILYKTNGGIVVNADEEFNFEEIELYNPPTPNYELLLKAMFEIFNNYDFYKNQIQKKYIDINYVAKQYVMFIQQSLKEI